MLSKSVVTVLLVSVLVVLLLLLLKRWLACRLADDEELEAVDEELELVEALPGDESFSLENLSLSSSVGCWGSCFIC